MKAVLADQDSVANEAAGAAHVENFALKVFMNADNEDRAGNTGKWVSTLCLFTQPSTRITQAG